MPPSLHTTSFAALRLARMLRHLRPAQVAHRLWYRARLPWFASDSYDRRLAAGAAHPPMVTPLALWPGDPANGARLLAGRIALLAEERPLAAPADWDAAGAPLLWRFTLHYFEWLADLEALGGVEAAARARVLVAEWLGRFGRFHPLAWHPYPLSLRLFAWLRHAPFLLDEANAGFRDAFLRAIDRQARHLGRVRERDVGGNHLVKNLKALVAAAQAQGDGPALARWLADLEEQARRQVLPDGAHYERSPAYHMQVLCDFLDVGALLGDGRPDWLAETIRRMAGAFRFFRSGDGGLALFNDGEVGEAGRLGALDRLLPETALPQALPEAGYFRLAAGPVTVLADAGRCCPDDLPAHAHADTLAFEMSDGAHRLVVNCGTYAYQDAAWRNALRGTACHSTVTVDGTDSAEVFGAFRLGRRPRRVEGKLVETETGIRFEGVHDGYRHLGVVHRRSLSLSPDGRRLDGEDVLLVAAGGHAAAARFHLHPQVAVAEEAGGVVLTLPGGAAWRFASDGGEFAIEASVYAPHFGVMQPTRCLVLRRRAAPPEARLTWRFERLGG